MCWPSYSLLHMCWPSHFLLHVPGLPTDSDLIYCKGNVSQACYFYYPTAVAYTTAKASCKAQEGDLVSWTSDEEQVRLCCQYHVCYFGWSAFCQVRHGHRHMGISLWLMASMSNMVVLVA
jgi:hypothetical protein